jgi:hypothetical protein
MRIVIVSLFIILGANLMIDLLDNNMMEVYQERQEALKKLTKQSFTK